MDLARHLSHLHQKTRRLAFDLYMRGHRSSPEIDAILYATQSLAHFKAWNNKANFDPNQPRDSHGRFATTGDSRGPQSPQPPTQPKPQDKPAQAAPKIPKEGDLDVQAAIKKLQENANEKSVGKCAAYVREALEAGGKIVERTESARDYGPNLIKAGLSRVSSTKKGANFPPKGYVPKAGDVAIIQPSSTSPHGHMQMYDGSQWISDFKQNGFYPGPRYRSEKPASAIYRVTMCQSPKHFDNTFSTYLSNISPSPDSKKKSLFAGMI